ncbi:MAG: hypothetical protein MK212_12785, partial [Saprospiraceae bacterium]|nr:hypothetical protein [Saprospiraceae bacterium]
MNVHIITIITLILFFSRGAWTQTTNIPDVNFEQELISQGIDSDGIVNGQVATADIAGVTSLDVSFRQIMDLTGIEDFISLEYLSCNNNLLTTLDLSNNPLLFHLQCRENQIISLDVSNNPELGWLKLANNQVTSLDLSNNTELFYLECNNNHLSQILLGQHDSLFYLDTGSFHGLRCQNNPAYLVICGNVPNTIPATWEKDSDATYSYGGCYPKRLQGKIAIDTNNNCVVDSTEQAFPNALIKIYNTTDTVIVYSDQNGWFSAGLDTGTYTIEATANLLWQACPNPQTFTVDTNNIQDINFAMQALTNCPLLTTDISAPFLRMTGGGSSYTVSYCNEGTLPEYNAYIEVNVDPDLNVTGSSLPIASQNGNIYTFLLDTIDIWECGSLTI